ncbi:hypothetical protein C7999DRAFT_39836 [Corynascus novoguineensis]|uniref:Nephrocystin 3-like N-terminal domain-containing protein n=1 Tax=Corynascus novoguineensis TaxID=1126955 RepID=A0AAN7CV59_9PEZI|nr:hypothetical protein C7999DRAFT_39836 [Corynascus novoguineensis]
MAMLDERHKDLPKQPNDPNNYILGSVGKHNIVIACLPAGQIGTISAATVARRCVPAKVRLGDVVISQPGDGFPGVIQWGIGKDTSVGFQRIGALGSPPITLLTAVARLKGFHGVAGWPRLGKYLGSRSLGGVRFRADYQHVGESSIYYEDDEEHDDAEISCRLCDRTKTVPRKARNEDDVKVHYGLIASGNKVIKDAHVRDRLNRELGGKVLCVEMEAEGLMKNFPCIAIRGICDYSDSHENNAWQKYAAAVAAAVAKGLLQYVTPYDVEREHTIKETIGHDKEYDQKVLNWLSPFDYSLQQDDHLRKHQAGDWRVASAIGQIQNLGDTHKQTLFCPGMPGARKTVLTAVVIDSLVSRFSNEQSVGIAYLYFNFWRQDDSRVEGLIANLLKQLVHRPPSPQACKHVRDFYDCHSKNRTRPSLHEITRCLELVIKEFTRCRARFIAELLKYSGYGANVFATSRFIPEVTEKFDKCPWLEIRISDEDVRAYVSVQIKQSESDILKEKRKKVMTRIADAADGMFLLAKLDMESLLDERLPRQARVHITGIRKGHKRVCEEPNSDPRSPAARLAREVPLWIACSKRRLGLAELQHALAIKPRDSGLKLENIPQEKHLVSVCAGLVIIDKTTQEYLEGARAQWFPNADNEITKVSVTYLAFDVFKSGRCSTGPDLEKRLEIYRLYDYAARYWGHHARDVHNLDPLVTAFLKELSKVEASSQILLGLSSTLTTGLHLAAYFGVDEAIRALLCQYDRDWRDGYYRTPLSWAAQNGHEVAVRLLLAEGADPISKDSSGLTPLMRAKQGKHEAIVRLLEGGVRGERGDRGI